MIAAHSMNSNQKNRCFCLVCIVCIVCILLVARYFYQFIAFIAFTKGCYAYAVVAAAASRAIAASLLR